MGLTLLLSRLVSHCKMHDIAKCAYGKRVFPMYQYDHAHEMSYISSCELRHAQRLGNLLLPACQ